MKRTLAIVLLALSTAATASAAPIRYSAILDGPSESPASASPGIGKAVVIVDDVADTMRVKVRFEGLLTGNTASHIHVINGPGDLNTSDTLGPVATATPTFPGFPSGATSGVYDQTFDLTLASTYRVGFVTSAGSLSAARTALLSGIADERAYLNIHTSTYPGGEIRGFLVPEPASMTMLGLALAGVVARRRMRR